MSKTRLPRLYTSEDAAERLGVGISRIAQICREHRIGLKLNGRYFTAEDIRKLDQIAAKKAKSRKVAKK